VDLITYWNVVKRQRRVVVIGLCAAAALALISVVKPAGTGLSWRSPPVYEGATTLLVAQPGLAEGRLTFEEISRMEYLASLYARLAESDRIVRAVSRNLDVEEADYEAAPLPGVEGRALPLIKISAFDTSPKRAVALANGTANALRTYVAREQGNNQASGKGRIEVRVVEAAEDAEVFQGVRLTRPVMLFLLVAMLTVGAAFVVDNFRGGRRPPQAGVGGESEATLGIVRDEPERPLAGEGSGPDSDVAARIQPASPDAEGAISAASPARGRWAAPS
jgi:capsular polysaccharide biosynthesis protein